MVAKTDWVDYISGTQIGGVNTERAVDLNALGSEVNLKANASGGTLTSPTITNYTESFVANGVVTTAKTLSLTAGTVQDVTLTASTTCVFTMPTAAAGKSFALLVKQPAATGNGVATFTGVKWPNNTAPTVTTGAGKADLFTFACIGTTPAWFGSVVPNYTY